jgi:hypothetical protein
VTCGACVMAEQCILLARAETLEKMDQHRLFAAGHGDTRHSQIAITANLYTHLLPEFKRSRLLPGLLPVAETMLFYPIGNPLIAGSLSGPSRTRTCDRPIMSRQL